MRKSLDVHFCLPSYQGPGRALWGSPWAPVLEVRVYFGSRPRLGGDPRKHSAQREVFVFIYARGLAGFRPGGWGKLERERQVCMYHWDNLGKEGPPPALPPSRALCPAGYSPARSRNGGVRSARGAQLPSTSSFSIYWG